MQVARPVASINDAMFVFIGISLSAVVLVCSVGRNHAAVVDEKVNYTLWYYSIGDYNLNDVAGYFDLSELSVRENRYIRFMYIQFKWQFKLTCWFTFQCPIGCQCILAATNITITCLGGVSIAEVEYPSGEWATYWISQVGEDKEYAPITIYFWVDSGLDNITQGAFKHLRHIKECYLIVSRNNIGDIQKGHFEELSKLRGLFLDSNEIASIHQNAFEGLDSLVFLYLYQNNVVGILPNLFQRLKKLNMLDIGYNKIVKIHPRGFEGLTNLRWLFLDYNRISKIHSLQFQDLTQLLELHLNRNKISKIHPLQFQNLNKLTDLNLSRNNISEIHAMLFQNLSSLQYLYLQHNMISEIHSLQFQNLHILIMLNLNHNTISEIHPLQFQNLSILSHFHIGQNLINEIHPLLFQSCSLDWLNLDHNMISEIHPLQFQNYSYLYWLNLGHNIISKFHPLQFQNVTELRRLYINHNKLSKLHPLQFQNLNVLRALFLHHNNISDIPANLFPNGLFTLDLAHNKISKIPQAMQNLSRLLQLNLKYNRISEIHPFLFQIITDIIWIELDHNEITEISLNQSLQELTFLDLSNNNLVKFTLPLTVKLSKLKYLSLSNNKLRVLEYTMFKHMLLLRYLDISSNHIKTINSVRFGNYSVPPIVLIDLRQNKLFVLKPETFSEFYNATVLVDNEATCCFITTVNCNATIPRSQFLTCGRLLPNMLQRVNMWILGLFALLSNLGVLFYRYHNKGKENKVQLLLISNLSISDMIMGVYMIIISSADLYYKRTFPSELWRLSFACKFAGTLSVLSSEASVFFVTLISVDRLIGIRYPFSTHRIDTKTSRILTLVLWLTAMSISIVSTILSSVTPDLYDVSEVCTGLPLSRKNVYGMINGTIYLGPIEVDNFPHTTITFVTGHQPGMYFGIAIFTALNFICFIVMCVCYIGIFVTTIETAKQAGRARDNKQERKMAMKMGVIVISDLACWAPIIILSILVQSGRHIVTPRVYTWIVTFVLPINSAINPFLYTFAALIFDFIHKNKQTNKQTNLALPLPLRSKIVIATKT